MARHLQRLGRHCAQHAWRVIIAWLLVLVAAIVTYVSAHGELATVFSLPDTPTTQVTAEMSRNFRDVDPGSARVVFSSDRPFTKAQKNAIDRALRNAQKVSGVRNVRNPFTVQDTSDQVGDRISESEAQLAAGKARLTAGQEQLELAQGKIDAGRQQIEITKQLPEVASNATALTALAEKEAEIKTGQTRLNAEKQKIKKAWADVAKNESKVRAARTAYDFSKGFRTVSANGRVALAMIGFNKNLPDVSQKTKHQVMEAISATDLAGAHVDFSTDLVMAIPELVGPGEIAGVIIAGIVLLVMLGTFVAAGLPIVAALLGVAIAVTSAMSLSRVVDMLSITPVLGLMLGLAVGIDYSLFILNRHRNQLLSGMNLVDSVGMANGTSGNAVVFAGSTVIIALVALSVTRIHILQMMGLVGALAVALAVIIAITFTPAMLGLLGRKVLPRRVRNQVRHPRKTREIKPFSDVRALVTTVVCVLGLVVLAIPALGMRTSLPGGVNEPANSTQYRAYQRVEQAFGAGANGPLLVLVTLPKAIASEDEVQVKANLAQRLSYVGGIEAISPIGVSEDRHKVAFQVIPRSDPSSAQTEQLVHDLRDLSGEEMTVGVAGNTSAVIDVSEILAGATPLYIPLVVGLSFLILVVVFRSIWVPLLATFGFVLSVLSSFGAVTWVFQDGHLAWLFGVHHPGPVLSFLPIIMVGILFGLAMDYVLFLVSGMEEAHARGESAEIAVRRGMYGGRVVVVAAATIMASVFAGFIFSESVMVKSIGFGLTLGIILDAFLVRLLLLPAFLHLFGERAWWLPNWLGKILPHLDLEGSRLEFPRDATR